MPDVLGLSARPDAPLLFLMNARGNRHTLAVRILSLWLTNLGLKTRIVNERAGLDDLVRDLAVSRPRFLLISMALLEQRDYVAAVAERIQALPEAPRPKVLVGGYPVKIGVVQSIPGADLVSDIGALSF